MGNLIKISKDGTAIRFPISMKDIHPHCQKKEIIRKGKVVAIEENCFTVLNFTGTKDVGIDVSGLTITIDKETWKRLELLEIWRPKNTFEITIRQTPDVNLLTHLQDVVDSKVVVKNVSSSNKYFLEDHGDKFELIMKFLLSFFLRRKDEKGRVSYSLILTKTYRYKIVEQAINEMIAEGYDFLSWHWFTLDQLLPYSDKLKDLWNEKHEREREKQAKREAEILNEVAEKEEDIDVEAEVRRRVALRESLDEKDLEELENLDELQGLVDKGETEESESQANSADDSSEIAKESKKPEKKAKVKKAKKSKRKKKK